MKQLCYASRATAVQPQLWSDLRDILTEARHFNYKNRVNGVLYFAEGTFFQCLEGDEHTLEILVKKLNRDPRHTHIQVFINDDIAQSRFQDWSMKYVSRHSEVSQFFAGLGLNQFKPEALDQHQLQDFLALLLQLNQSETVNEIQ